MSKAVKKDLLDELARVMTLTTGDASARRDCLVKLDTLLGKSLAYAGIKGDSMGERLKNATTRFDRKQYDAIWDVHKLRNSIVHEQQAISVEEVKRASAVFSATIRKLLT